MTDGPREWTLTLNQYQRDNLLQLINVVGWPSTYKRPDYETDSMAVEPFQAMNTGDWVGEIGYMLRDENAPWGASVDAERSGDPLVMRSEVAQRVAARGRVGVPVSEGDTQPSGGRVDPEVGRDPGRGAVT